MDCFAFNLNSAIGFIHKMPKTKDLNRNLRLEAIHPLGEWVVLCRSLWFKRLMRLVVSIQLSRFKRMNRLDLGRAFLARAPVLGGEPMKKC